MTKTRATRYLLNELPDEERDRFEEELLGDDEAFADMLAEEDDLLDAYVNGALDDSARHAVQQRYLTHPELRSRLDFAQTLKERNEKGEARQNEGAVVRPFAARVLPLAVAAVLVLVIAGILAYRRAPQSEEETARRRLQPAPSATMPQPATDTSAGPMLADTSTEQVSEPPIPHAVILTFAAAVTRGSDDVPSFALKGAPLQLELNIDPAETYSRYRIEVTSKSGEKKFTSPPLERQKLEGRTWVEASIPPNVLDPGKYEVRLTGISNGAEEDIAFHEFDIHL